MSLSSCLCTNNTKNMLVKIVHPGGHVELHDRGVIAAEIMLRNPKCCVAYPYVFQQPWAIVAPDTMLMPGHKFYVVPLGTIRKLQRLSLRQSPSPIHEFRRTQSSNGGDHDDGIYNKNLDRKACFSGNNCFVCFFSGHNVKENEDEERKSCDSGGSLETSMLTRDRKTQNFTSDSTRGSPKKLISLDSWQPSLQSITEE